MFMPVAKAQQVNEEPQAQAGERKGTGSAAGRRSQMEGYLKSQGGKEKMDVAQGLNIYISLAKRRHKGKMSWKNHAREKVLEIVYKV